MTQHNLPRLTRFEPALSRAASPILFSLASVASVSILLVFSTNVGAEEPSVLALRASKKGDGAAASALALPSLKLVVEPLSKSLLGDFRRLVRPVIAVPVQSRDGVVVDDWSWLAMTAGVVLVGAGLGLHWASPRIADRFDENRRAVRGGAMMGLGLPQFDGILGRPAGIDAVALAIGTLGGASIMTGVVLALQPVGGCGELRPKVSRDRAVVNLRVDF